MPTLDRNYLVLFAHKHGSYNNMFCLWSLWSNLNVLTFFLPCWGMLRRPRCVQILGHDSHVSLSAQPSLPPRESLGRYRRPSPHDNKIAQAWIEDRLISDGCVKVPEDNQPTVGMGGIVFATSNEKSRMTNSNNYCSTKSDSEFIQVTSTRKTRGSFHAFAWCISCFYYWWCVLPVFCENPKQHHQLPTLSLHVLCTT